MTASSAMVDAWHELAPLLRRCVDLQPGVVARTRVADGVASVLVRLPFGVLVGRSVRVGDAPAGDPVGGDPVGGDPVGGDPAVGDVNTGAGLDGDTEALDAVLGAAEILEWLAGSAPQPPRSRAHEWRSTVPPRTGWRRVETVPDDVIRPLVRKGALALKDAAAREGVPGAQPRAQVSEALLDAVVLTVDDTEGGVDGGARGGTVEISLRALSALTRMGFLTRGGPAHVDVAGRWIRVVGGYGTVYLERPGTELGLRPVSG